MASNTFSQDFFTFSKDIKLSHSFFSFPFVGANIIIGGFQPTFIQILYILISLTCARSFAMGMNRYLDREIDARNPRTAKRALPSKNISCRRSLLISLGFGVLFILSTLPFNRLTFFCSLPVLIILGCYPLIKRWSTFCHLYLGICLSLSPVAASIALSGKLSIASIFIGVSMFFWVSGFDIIYATEDYTFDTKEGIFSIPQTFGVESALKISQLFFFLMVITLGALGFFYRLGIFYYTGLTIISGILFWEHISLTKRKKNESINPIFFTANAWLSVIFFAFVLIDSFILK